GSEALGGGGELVKGGGENGRGRTFLKKALAADARALDLAGDGRTAYERWREVLGIDSRDVDAWLGLAQATSDEDEAYRAIETAFEINPNDERVAAEMAKFRLDPAAFEAPSDAFERLEKPDD